MIMHDLDINAFFSKLCSLHQVDRFYIVCVLDLWLIWTRVQKSLEKCNLPKAEAGFEQRCDWTSSAGFCNEKEKHHGVLVQMKDKHHGLMRRRSITVSWSRWRDRQGAKSREGMRATFPAGEIQLTTWIWTYFYTVSIKQPFNHPTSSLITSGSVSPFQGKLKLPTT